MSGDRDLNVFVEEARARVDEALDRGLPAATEPPEPLHEAMRYAVFSGGKRLRPALAYAGALAGGASPESADPIACAVELVHAYSLVHDDLPAMDDDSQRRGRPTVHIAYGEANAILVGDALLAQAFAQLAPSDHAAEATSRLADAAGSRALVGGQVDDLGFDPAEASLDSITSIHLRKTAALFRFAVWGGGLTAGLPAAALERLDAFGRAYGLAFQLADDLSDADLSECSILHCLSPQSAGERTRSLLVEALKQVEPLGESAWALRGLAKRLEQGLP